MGDQRKTENQVSFFGAVAIGVGGMVGGGIFAVLGLATVLAGGATPIAFLIAGIVALLTAYSYSKLSVAYPDNGGTIIFIDRAFKINWFTGSVNNLLWIGYIVTIALYAVAFGNYAATFLPKNFQTLFVTHVLITLGILLPTLLNLLSASIVSRAETYVVAVKIAILVLIIALGFGSVDTARLQPSTWKPWLQIVSAGMIIFVAFEGFELIANTAATIKNPKLTLPRAYYFSVLFVILLYVLIAYVVVGSLAPDKIAASQDFALAEAAKPSLGQFGFVLVGIAAILATLSAINSTLYGSARLSYAIATEGELPVALERKVWNQPVGLLITAVGALLLANLADLSSISIMASASFLIIFALVNLANFVKSKDINSSKVIAGAGVLACFMALLALLYHTIQENSSQLWALLGLISLSFIIEGVYILFLKKEKQSERIRNEN
ncbi:MAG: APC family permease [Ardenticatenaceae bacterium]